MKMKKLENEKTWEFKCYQCEAHVIDIKVDELEHDLLPKPYYTCPNCGGINRPKKSKLTINEIREAKGFEDVPKSINFLSYFRMLEPIKPTLIETYKKAANYL